MSGRAGRALFDLAAVIFILSLLWMPSLSDFAGVVFSTEIFFHWDHFVVAPALAWRHGMALGVEAYSQYGAGWPVLLNLISDIVPLTHQNVIQLGVAYGNLVFVGLYALLVVLGRSRILALAGTLLALYLSPFAPSVVDQPVGVLWVWPSLTVLRAPMEVWFFLALLLHARGRRPTTSLAAGLCVGLGLLLETDTGIFLAATFAVYGLCLVLAERFAQADGAQPSPSAPPGLVFAATLATALGVLVAGLSISSRGALLAQPLAFLGGWIGGVTNSSSLGVGALDFNWFLVNHGEDLAWALVVLGSGLLAVGFSLTRLLHGRIAPSSLFAGCVGLYAVARCTLFVWRTNPIRLTLAAVPLAILAVMALAALRRPVGDALRRIAQRDLALADHALPLLALFSILPIVLACPSFAAYPNPWHATSSRAQAESGAGPRSALFPKRGEITGIDPKDRPILKALRTTIREVRARAARGERVAVVDPYKTLVFLEADVRPWRGSPSWFANTWTHDQLAALAETLGLAGPDAVIIRSRAPSHHSGDIWEVLHATVAEHYRAAGRIGMFEIWERR